MASLRTLYIHSTVTTAMSSIGAGLLCLGGGVEECNNKKIKIMQIISSLLRDDKIKCSTL